MYRDKKCLYVRNWAGQDRIQQGFCLVPSCCFLSYPVDPTKSTSSFTALGARHCAIWTQRLVAGHNLCTSAINPTLSPRRDGSFPPPLGKYFHPCYIIHQQPSNMLNGTTPWTERCFSLWECYAFRLVWWSSYHVSQRVLTMLVRAQTTIMEYFHRGQRGQTTLLLMRLLSVNG